jgi:hypothetical protein
MTPIAMEVCPVCATCPQLAGRWRLRVQCRCGACGPRTKSEHEAIGRWNSVASFMRELTRTGATLGRASHAESQAAATRPIGLRRLTRRVAWQYGLQPELGL